MEAAGFSSSAALTFSRPFQRKNRGRRLGCLAQCGMAAVLGPNIGSFLLDWTGSWHWLFLINLPIAVLLVVFGAYFIAETKAPEAKRLDAANLPSIPVDFSRDVRHDEP
nr:MFS transporter [Bacillus subtilis]